jgi:hypothetical protein
LDTSPCRSLIVNRRFEGICRLHLQGWRINQACYLLYVRVLLVLFFHHEDRGDMFLRNVGIPSTDYTALYTKRWDSSWPTLSESQLLYNKLAEEQCRVSNSLRGAQCFFSSRQLLSYSRMSQNSMQPGGSLLCSQEPSSGTYPEPDESSPCYPTIFF